MKQTDTDTLVQALRILASDIHCEDGVATSVIREAADRIEKFDELATDVVRRAIRGDQHFIKALDDDRLRTRLLRYAIARLDDQLKEW